MTELAQQAQIAISNATYEANGNHFLLKLAGCEGSQLNDEKKLIDLATRAAQATGATVLEVISRKFDPQGVTVLVMLAESHASLHTYPEWGVVFWDCFTCGQTCTPELSAQVLKAELKPNFVNEQVVARQ